MIKRFFSLKAFIATLALAACLAATAVAQQDLTFTTPDGQRVTLSGMRGKVTLLVFSSVEDPQCRDLFKALQSLSERYSGKDVNITWSAWTRRARSRTTGCGTPAALPVRSSSCATRTGRRSSSSAAGKCRPSSY